MGIDIGGTFIDLVILDPETGHVAVGKKLSSAESPVRSVIEGIKDILKVETIAPSEIRDALEIGREMRYDIYDIFLELPKPLSPRRCRLEVAERLDNSGNVLVALTQQEAERAVDELLALDIESAAICLLHSFRKRC